MGLRVVVVWCGRLSRTAIGGFGRLMSKVFPTKVVGRRVPQDEKPMSSGGIRVTRLVVLGLRGDC